MPYSSIQRHIWDDPWFADLSRDARLLFFYFFTNTKINILGCYPILLRTAAVETGFSGEDDPAFVEAMESLSSRVCWYPEQGLIWVKNFLRYQSGGPKTLQGAANCLANGIPVEVGQEVIEYNRQRGVRIPYRYPMHGVSTIAEGLSLRTEQEQEQDLEAGATSAPPSAPPALSLNNPRPTWPEEARVLQSIAGYPFDAAKDGPLMDTLAEAYAQLDLAQELLRMKTWLVARGYVPLRGQAGPRFRVRRWMQKADEIWRDRRLPIQGEDGGEYDD